jgi:hypothetical protein
LEHRKEAARVLGRLEYIRRFLEPYDDTPAAEGSAENPKSGSEEAKVDQPKEKKKGYVDARQAQRFCTELKRHWNQLTFMEQARRISKINQYEKRIEKNLSAPKRHDLLAGWVGLKDDTIANRLSVFDMKKFVQEAADRMFFTDPVFEHTRYLIQSGRTEECREYLQTLDQLPSGEGSHLRQRIKDRIANFHYRKIFETDEEIEKREQIEERLTEEEWYELNPDLPENHPLRLNIGSESPFRLVPFNSIDYHRLRNENPEPERVILENRSGKFFVLPYIVLVQQTEKRVISGNEENE